MGKLIAIGVLAVVAFGGFLLMQNGSSSKEMVKETSKPEVSAGMTKDFTLTAYYDDKGVWYSLKEMRVKVGDAVRIKATNTKGMHDFIIDELGVKKELPLDQEVTIEFKADKPGSYVYYCSKPGHRAKGQWGTLIVE